jgi:uncharacterized protein (DUF488 family)
MPELYTIGHSNVAAETLVSLLHRHRIEVLVDVRSVPYSRHNPQFNRESLARTMEAAGIAYVYMGRHLGGRPDDPACYEGGQGEHHLIEVQPWYREAIDRLVALAGRKSTAVLCAEENPLHCHRHHLIAQTLLRRGVTVWHIRGDGRVEPAEVNPPKPRQLPLL